MASRQQFIDKCRELGVWAFASREVIRVDTPPGKKFSTGIHFFDLYLKGWKQADAYDSLIADLNQGIEECDEWDCEICCEPMTPEDIERLYSCERIA